MAKRRAKRRNTKGAHASPYEIDFNAMIPLHKELIESSMKKWKSNKREISSLPDVVATTSVVATASSIENVCLNIMDKVLEMSRRGEDISELYRYVGVIRSRASSKVKELEFITEHLL